MANIFISHAHADQALADKFGRLLEGGINLSQKQIFCTSLEEQGIPAGKDFKTFIQEKLAESEVVVALISPNYYASAFCMCELGATWIMSKDFVPFVVPPLDFDDLKGVLHGMQVLRISDASGLDQARDRIARLAKEPAGTARWTKRKEEFLHELDGVLKALPKPKVIKSEDYKKLKDEKEDYKHEYEKSDENNKALRKQIEDLKEAKGKAQVAAIQKKYSTEWETFESLALDARKQLKQFPRVVREAFFQYFRGSEFRPSMEEWGEEPNGAMENGFLDFDDAEGTFSVNEDNPKIKRALSAVRLLRKFVTKEASSDFSREYQEEYDENLDMQLRPFWERELMS